MTAPYGDRWPGPAPAGVVQADPDALAAEYAEHLVERTPSMRLGLVTAARGADALAATGWSGPLNYTDDTGEIAAEHFAICPGNVWQDAHTLTAYAERLVGVNAWEFWWD